MTVRYDFDSRSYILTIPAEVFARVPLSVSEIAMVISSYVTKLVGETNDQPIC